MDALTKVIQYIWEGWNWSTGTIILSVLGVLVIAYVAQRKDDAFDFRDLVAENGKISLTKFSTFTALCVSSWIAVTLVVKDNLTEWYMTMYMLAWTGNNLISKYLSTKNDSSNPPPTQGP